MLLLALAGPVAGQPSLSPDTVVLDVVAMSDPAERYALYLPRLTPGRRPPVLLLMDPRGRAALPLAAFRPAASRLGYVVLSSYNTLSDENDDTVARANGRALTAMITDAVNRYGGDPARVYLVGLSGAASYAWGAAAALEGRVAGVVGVGCPLTPDLHPVRTATSPFDYVAVVGTTDYNYDAAVVLDEALNTTRRPHRLLAFSGEHGWPPEPVAREAVEWLHYQAVGRGLAPKDIQWADSLGGTYLARARDHAAVGDDEAALQLYRAAGGGRGPGAQEARRLAEDIARSPRGQQARERVLDHARRYFDYERDVAAFAALYRAIGPLPLAEALDALGLDRLAAAVDTAGAEEADAARRMLALAYVVTAFYEPRALLKRGDWAKAAGFLQISRAILPDAPHACYGLAQAESQRARFPQALEALGCAAAGGVVDRGLLSADPLLAPLRRDERFQALADGLPDRRSPPTRSLLGPLLGTLEGSPATRTAPRGPLTALLHDVAGEHAGLAPPIRGG
ncbi:MAG TPA: hypothetical protein VF576_11605 [Rubricoccaceae bacterium]